MKHLLYIFLFISFLCFTEGSQESRPIQALNLFNNLLQDHETSDLDLAVSVNNTNTITEISSSIIKAETWLKTHVLSLYPSTKITTIVIFSPVSSCQHKPNLDLVLSSLKNLHHSLTRWGLEKNIKVSYGFSYHCLEHLEMFKHVLVFLNSINSTFTINPSPNLISSSHKHLDLLRFVEKFESLHFKKVNIINLETAESTRRRNLRSLPENPFSSAPSPFSFPPEPSLPPCLPPLPPSRGSSQGKQGPALAPSPAAKKKKDVDGLWCVAKPSVADETLQQSLDFACGQGGADCDEIRPHGICYYPDTTMAHASYAFNSYWQKTKRNGGTCSFGGTAMLITTDPSYQHCRFILS